MVSLYLLLLINRALYLYEMAIVVWCVMTYVPMREGSVPYDVREALGRLVAPYLGLCRRIVPPVGGMDFSPMVAILALVVVERLLVVILF